MTLAKSQRVADWLVARVLPIGWFVLLSGLFWIWDRQLYSQSFYLLIALPTFAALALRPALVALIFSNPLVRAFIPFACYMTVTILWSGTDSAPRALIERPLYVFLLLSATCLMAAHSSTNVRRSTILAACVASLAALISLGYFHFFTAEPRLPGYGALFNPLLTSHVFGFFLAFWMAVWIADRKFLDAPSLCSIAVLTLLVMATGSRTPLAGVLAVMVWLVIARGDRRTLLALGAATLAAVPLVLANLEQLASRGVSYRPDIWAEAVRQITERPWFGHGLGHPVALPIAGIEFPFADPHNIHLAVLFHGGIVGFALWLVLYAAAFLFAWRRRREPVVLIASSLVVFGLVASMTEGGGFFSRPREHWFLIWLPLSALAAAWTALQQEKSTELLKG